MCLRTRYVWHTSSAQGVLPRKHRAPNSRERPSPGVADLCTSQPTYNITLLIAFESLYQVLTVAAFFFTDIIPGFGTSTSFSSFISCVTGDYRCQCQPPPAGRSGAVSSRFHGVNTSRRQVKGGFTCFFDPTALPDAPHCDYSAALGFQFALMYCLSCTSAAAVVVMLYICVPQRALFLTPGLFWPAQTDVAAC